MGKRAQRRAAEDLARYVIKNQVEPQMIAAKMREQGIDVETGFVNVGPDAEGFTVTCTGCGRTGKLPFDPGDKVGMCPACMRAHRGRS